MSFFSGLQYAYLDLLRWVLHQRLITILIAALLLATSLLLLPAVLWMPMISGFCIVILRAGEQVLSPRAALPMMWIVIATPIRMLGRVKQTERRRVSKVLVTLSHLIYLCFGLPPSSSQPGSGSEPLLPQTEAGSRPGFLLI